MNLGNAIKLVRVQRGINQGELARLAGMSVSYLSLIERSKREPTMSTIERIAKGLNIPLTVLLFLASPDEMRQSLGVELEEKLADTLWRLIKEEG